jgi:hypothetical protein
LQCHFAYQSGVLQGTFLCLCKSNLIHFHLCEGSFLAPMYPGFRGCFAGFLPVGRVDLPDNYIALTILEGSKYDLMFSWYTFFKLNRL